MPRGDSATTHFQYSRERISGGVLPKDNILLLFLLLVVAAIARDIHLAILGALVCAVIAIARLWAHLSLSEVLYQHETSNVVVMEGQQVDCVMQLENRKPLPVPWLKLVEQIPRGLTVTSDYDSGPTFEGGTRLQLETSLGPFQRVKFRYSVTAARRGHYKFGPTLMQSGDIFGFYQWRQRVLRSQPDLVVLPRILPLPGLQLPPMRPLDGVVTRRPLSEDYSRPAGLRAYRAGDAVKKIDWKITARRRELFVRTFDHSVQQSLMILLDCEGDKRQQGGGALERLDQAVVAAASIAVASRANGFAVGLATNGVSPGPYSQPVTPPGESDQHLRAILQTLAGAQTITLRSIANLVLRESAGAIPRDAVLIYLANHYHRDSLDFLRRKQAGGHRVLVIKLENQSTADLDGLEIIDFKTLTASGESTVAVMGDANRAAG